MPTGSRSSDDRKGEVNSNQVGILAAVLGLLGLQFERSKFSLSSLSAILHTIDLHFWVADLDFVDRRVFLELGDLSESFLCDHC